MADETGNSEELILQTQQAANALNALIKQAKEFRGLLQDTGRFKTAAAFDQASSGAARANKQIKNQLDQYASALSNLDQKLGMTVRRVNNMIASTGTTIGQEANRLKSVANQVKDALSIRAPGPSLFTKDLKSATEAAELLRTAMRKLAVIQKQIDTTSANRGDTTSRREIVASFEAQREVTVELQVAVTELAAKEREEAAAARDAARARTQAEREALAANRAAARERAELNNLEMQGTLRVLREENDGRQNAARQAERIAREQAANLTKIQNAQAAEARRQQTLQTAPARRFATQGALLANYAVLGGATAGAYEIGSEVVKLDEALHNLQGIVQITDVGMAGLRQRILDTASASKFMASDIADAATTLGQAGLSATQIGESLEAVTKFAQATGISLKDSVDLMTSAMGAFNIRADETMNLANMFTAALNNSKLTVEQLSTGFQYSATSAAEMGVSISELTTLMALMANAGIRSGSIIGTGIRQVINQLSAPSTKFQVILRDLGIGLGDIDIRSHGLITVLETLKDAGFNAGSAFQAFGTRGAGAFIALTNQLDTARDVQKSIIGTQAAALAAATQMESLSNSAKKLGAQIGALAANGFDPLLHVLVGVLGVLGGAVNIFGANTTAVQLLTTALGVGAALMVGQYLNSMLSITAGIRALITTTYTFAVASGEVRAAMLLAAGEWLPIIAVIGGLTAAIVGFNYVANEHTRRMQENAAAVEDASGKYQNLRQMYQQLQTETQNLINKEGDLTDKSGDVAKHKERLGVLSQELGEKFRSLGLDISNLNGNYDELLSRMRAAATLSVRLQASSLVDLRDANQKLFNDQQQDAQRFRGPELGIALSNATYGRIPIGTDADAQTAGLKTALPGVNSAALTAYLKEHGGQTGANVTYKDADTLNSILLQLGAADTSKMSDAQKDILKRVTGVFNDASKSVTAVATSGSNIASANTSLGGANIIQQQWFQKFQTQLQGFQSRVNKEDPSNDSSLNNGSDAVRFQKAYDAYRQKIEAEISVYEEGIKKFASASPANKAAVQQSGILQTLIDMQAKLETTSADSVKKAKDQLGVLAKTDEAALQIRLETAQADLSQAKTPAAAKEIAERIHEITLALFQKQVKAYATEKLDIDPDKVSTDANGHVIVDKSVKLSQTQQYEIDALNNQNDATLARNTDRANNVGDRIDRKDDKAENSADVAKARQAIATLNAQIKAINDAITADFKNIDKYTSISDIQVRTADALKKLEELRQARLAEITKEVAEAKAQGHPISPEDKAARDAAVNADIDTKVGEVKDRSADLQKEPGRLPSGMSDAYAAITGALEDPRKTNSKVDQFATLFQDTMLAAISNVRSNFGSMWSSIIDGSKSAGDAFKAFGKSLLESILNVLTNSMTQQFLQMFLGFVPGGSSSVPSISGGVSGGSSMQGIQSSGGVGQSLFGMGTSLGTGWLGSLFGNNGVSEASKGAAGFASQAGGWLSDAWDAVSSIFRMGGEVQHRAGGGPITGGVQGRDSVYKYVRPGSFIMRQSAVSRLGPNVLDRINAYSHGGSVLAKLMPGEYEINPEAAHSFGMEHLRRLNSAGNSAPTLMASGGALMAHMATGMDSSAKSTASPFADGRLKAPDNKAKPHQTNVWVVSPDQQPQMGPNDVLTVVGRDITTGGSIKKLIRSVVAGG